MSAGPEVRMVDTGAKPVSARTARAAVRVEVRPETARRILDGTLPKGDAIATARVAGILAAKRTPELIPLCHPVALTSAAVDVRVDPDRGTVDIETRCEAQDRTGVEMEALVAAAVAALTIYDLIKGIDRGAVVTDLRLLEKTGGVRGDWRAPAEGSGPRGDEPLG